MAREQMKRERRTGVGKFSLVCGVLSFLLLAGCSGVSTPPEPRLVEHPLPELNVIQKKFDQVVADVYKREGEVWHHGTFGNYIIYWNGGNNRGWCFEWQSVVYRNMIETIRGAGWEAAKINVGVGTAKEHHVVLVYDPEVHNLESIQKEPFGAQAWVLDAWYHGRPDIYLLKDWLAFVYDNDPGFKYE